VLPLPPEAPRRYRHVISGRKIDAMESTAGGPPTLDIAQVFDSFPVALLAGEDE
jgi:hypothetical protein